MILILLTTLLLSSSNQTDPGIHAGNYKHPQKAQKATSGYFASKREMRSQQRHYKQVSQASVALTTDAVQPPHIARKKANYKNPF